MLTPLGLLTRVFARLPDPETEKQSQVLTSKNTFMCCVVVLCALIVKHCH